MITKFNNYIKESLRDKMTPKTEEEIQQTMDRYMKSGTVHTYDEIIGKVLSEVIVSEQPNATGDDRIIFKFEDGDVWNMYHEQDCCEQVSIEDVNGDVNDLVGVPLLKAEEVTTPMPNPMNDEHTTWTFYKFATIKGYVDIRWYGSSNGYYSEEVTFKKVEN